MLSRPMMLLVCLAGTMLAAGGPCLAQLPPGKDLPPSATLSPEEERDVLGVRLGMTSDEVERAVRSTYPQAQVTKSSTTLSLAATDGSQISGEFLREMRLTSKTEDGATDTFKATFASPLTGGRLLYLHRELSYLGAAQKGGDLKALESGIEAKYGKPTFVESSFKYYSTYGGKRVPPLDYDRFYDGRYTRKGLFLCKSLAQEFTPKYSTQLTVKHMTSNDGLSCGSFLWVVLDNHPNPALFSGVSFYLYDVVRARKDAEALDAWLIGEYEARKKRQTGAAPRL